jgi:hypothetical protein
MRLANHEQKNGKHFAWFDLEEGSVFIIIIEMEGVFIPIEARVSSLPAEQFEVSDLKYLMNKWTPKEVVRLPGPALRQVSLTEAINKIRGNSPQDSLIEKTLEEQLGGRGYAIIKDVPFHQHGFRNTRDFSAAVSRLEVAILYARFVSAGETRPINAIADELDIDAERARRLVAGARKDGYLTSDNQGSIGGTLTEKAKEFIKLLKKETGKK